MLSTLLGPSDVGVNEAQTFKNRGHTYIRGHILCSFIIHPNTAFGGARMCKYKEKAILTKLFMFNCIQPSTKTENSSECLGSGECD